MKSLIYVTFNNLVVMVVKLIYFLVITDFSNFK